MKIAIRVDSSFEIGSGHVMRCLSLAAELKKRGSEITFLSSDLPGSICDIISSRGFELKTMRHSDSTKEILKADLFDWLVVDHYSLGRDWESQMRPFVNHIMAIDDLANRVHDVDVLLDQNFYDNGGQRYDSLISPNCKKLLGTSYALLREEFSAARKSLKPHSGEVQNIFVNFGGVDSTNEALKVVRALKEFKKSVRGSVVVGQSHPDKESVEQLCRGIPDLSFQVQVSNISKFMQVADIAIGAGGSTTWERCCLGLPSLLTVLAENQRQHVDDLDKYGAIKKVGWSHEMTSEKYLQALEELKTEELRTMSRRAYELVDGQGCARVADAIGF